MKNLVCLLLLGVGVDVADTFVVESVISYELLRSGEAAARDAVVRSSRQEMAIGLYRELVEGGDRHIVEIRESWRDDMMRQVRVFMIEAKIDDELSAIGTPIINTSSVPMSSLRAAGTPIRPFRVIIG